MTASGPAAGQEPLRIMIVDDHEVVREGLASILRREPDLEVAGVAATAEEAIEILREARADVIVLDYRLPGMSGLDLCREVAEHRVSGEVVVLSAYLDEEVARLAVLSGARAYVVKDVDPAGLKTAIRLAARGELTVDPRVGPGVLAWVGEGSGGPQALSPDERDILRHVAAGEDDGTIAALTGLSVRELRARLRSLLDKLGVRTRAEAAAAALRRGLG